MAPNATVQITEPNVSFDELAESARRLRRELLTIPTIAAETTLKFMTPRVGVRVAETVGTLRGDMQFGPYNESREDNEDVNITPRTLRTYLGSCVKNFRPNDIVKSIWGPSVLHGEAMKQTEIVRKVLAFLAARLGENLNDSIFSAVRNAEGDTTKDLFNGFDTIFADEVKAVKTVRDAAIAAVLEQNSDATAEDQKLAGDAAVKAMAASGKQGVGAEFGNLYDFGEAIDSNNAYDALRAMCKAANEKLLNKQELYLYCPRHVVWDYAEDYRKVVGSVIYNKQFNQPVIEGFENVHFVPLSNKQGSKVLQLTTKKNMLYGLDKLSDLENVEVARFKAFQLQFIATMFFGTEYESIDKENILFAVNGTSAV